MVVRERGRVEREKRKEKEIEGKREGTKNEKLGIQQRAVFLYAAESFYMYAPEHGVVEVKASRGT